MKASFLGLGDLGVSPSRSGKVRETLDLGDTLLIVTTDRISAFDCILPTPIPGKGKLLNRISAHWFRGLSSHVATHFVSDGESDFPAELRHILPSLRDRWMLVRKALRIPVECVVRGHLAGSGLREYAQKGTVGGIEVAPGIEPYGKLPAPLFTPTTKEDVGHDRPVSFEELEEIVGAGLAAELRRISLRIFELAEPFAAARGLTLVDTKFEFGWIDGKLTLIDEVLTPDSSRYWDAERPAAGAPVSLDKEFVREHLMGTAWDRNPPAPPLPQEIIEETFRRYQRVHDRIGAGGSAPELGRGRSSE
ncbi:MAG: phosphoribosylaminoimidazolesuccinocarboxamide synthase [Candidatus Eisenbacteria bacterium]|nr:phosphoribosylaminoimidazolesuccinocarboxamide synthase [Candidatus Eisenbacteria bacterium]